MFEPWGSILAWSLLCVKTVCLVVLVYATVRFRSAAFLLLALALIVWPFLGDYMEHWASVVVERRLAEGPNRVDFGTVSLSSFTMKVQEATWSVQALLDLSATLVCLRDFGRRRAANQSTPIA